MLSLQPGIPVAVANIDSEVTMPAFGLVERGAMAAIMGTSTVYMLLGDKEVFVPGMGAVAKDGIIPGYYGYTAGQSCVGDLFGWLADNFVPVAYVREAEVKNLTVHQLLEQKAAAQKAGQHGLIALDWWNGNRSVLADMSLSGLLVGMTMQTRPEDIYRALIEATAFGARKIVEAFEGQGVSIHAVYAAGGIPAKNKLFLQIYADVLNRPVFVAECENAPALGSAIFGAVAAGGALNGYETVGEAAKHMGRISKQPIRPAPENAAVYDRLYALYSKLHDGFGGDAGHLMRSLRDLAAGQRTVT
ncbi:MAG: FGGY-family carbohydrate kinase [Oscillibacter sp.]|nr:FGGY-family carbohydrate kinase [Oscillibacter sp.]